MNEILLHLRQFNAGAIAIAETLDSAGAAGVAFFAFEQRVDAADINENLRIGGVAECLSALIEVRPVEAGWGGWYLTKSARATETASATTVRQFRPQSG